MGYNETTNLKLKKPTPLTPETDWPEMINSNFDAIDAEVTARRRIGEAFPEDIVPDRDTTRSIGSGIKRFLRGFFHTASFNEITLGGVTRTAWPSPGSGSQSMDDTYNNGSVVNVDHTDEVHRLATGRKFKLTNSDGTVTYMEAEGGKGLVQPPFQNLLSNSQFSVWSNSTLENVGSNLIAGWTNDLSYPYFTLTSSGSDISGAINTSGASASSNTNTYTTASGRMYQMVITLCLNSGEAPTLYFRRGDDSGWVTGAWPLSNGVNTILYRDPSPGASAFALLQNTAVCNWSATVILCEVIAGCVAADYKGPDGWTKSSGGGNYPDIYRQYNDSLPGAGLYVLKFIGSTVDSTSLQYGSNHGIILPSYYKQFAGQQVSFGLMVKASAAGKVCLRLADGASAETVSNPNKGTGWEWVEVSRAISDSPAYFAPYISVDANYPAVEVCFATPMLALTSCIGEGKYAPMANEEIWLETPVVSAVLNNSGRSTTPATSLDVEVDTFGKLGNGIKGLRVYMQGNDSLSASWDVWFALESGTNRYEAHCNPAGLVNDAIQRVHQVVPVGPDGTILYRIAASGSGTFDAYLKYEGVRV